MVTASFVVCCGRHATAHRELDPIDGILCHVGKAHDLQISASLAVPACVMHVPGVDKGDSSSGARGKTWWTIVSRYTAAES